METDFMKEYFKKRLEEHRKYHLAVEFIKKDLKQQLIT
jgi:hypothetical protein